jgi:hypothetical protein
MFTHMYIHTSIHIDQVFEARGNEEEAVFDDADVSRPEVLQFVGACSGFGFRVSALELTI